MLEGTLEYAYNYEQYGNVGNYTITPSGLTSTNYNITYHTGTLTVEQKEVGLTWSEPTSFVYDGASHGLTATATNLVNGDEIGVTVTGAQINGGNHIATASALTGTKAGNYKLPTENTHVFTIIPAQLTVTFGLMLYSSASFLVVSFCCKITTFLRISNNKSHFLTAKRRKSVTFLHYKQLYISQKRSIFAAIQLYSLI